jgi:hypothetical protein
MNYEVFTAGIESGGLTTDFEIRILICWLFWKLKTPMTFTRLNTLLQQKGLINYFELTRSVSQLIQTGHLSTQITAKEEEDFLVLSELGRQTAQTFENSLPFSIREKTMNSAENFLMRERYEKENSCDIETIEGGFIAKFTMTDIGSDLLRMQLFVPTEELCERVKENFLNDPTILYRAVVNALTGEKINAENENFDEQMRLDI